MKRLVIIPTYNEIENIEAMIEKVFSLPEPFDMLVIDDGSPDGTAAVVRQAMAQRYAGRLHMIERSGKLGLGTAYIAGFKWALQQGYDYIFEMDCDFSHNPDDLLRLYKACHEGGADVAIGSRYVTGVNVINWPIGRVIMSYYASAYVRWVLGIPVKDCTAGFVCFRAEVLRTIDLDQIRMKGYGFQIEMKYSAWKLGFRTIEVPIIFTDRTKGSSKMSSGIFGEAFWGVLRMRFRKILPASRS
ncbi:polyprenol monophosphomannose synthase [Millionella massiliensis]|uniref:polyprenol monophosphomannose synthase n=1 Tax=Millionella massiliensis TaxID=1871023 RepID=UPI0008DB0E29|nr:polyprenol monophosphomannose synthase [Millionella massiliensis]